MKTAGFISLESLSGLSVLQKMPRVREISDGLAERQSHLWSSFKDFSLAAEAAAGKFRAASCYSDHRPWVVGAAARSRAWVDTMFPCSQ